MCSNVDVPMCHIFTSLTGHQDGQTGPSDLRTLARQAAGAPAGPPKGAREIYNVRPPSYKLVYKPQ